MPVVARLSDLFVRIKKNKLTPYLSHDLCLNNQACLKLIHDRKNEKIRF